MFKNGLLIALGVFVLLIGRMSFQDTIEYRHIKQDPKDIEINRLSQDNIETEMELALALAKTQGEVDKVKKEMMAEIERVKKEDKNVESKINAMNKHLRGKLARKGDMFYYAGSLYNVNPLLLAAISMQETGNGSSNAIKTKNNVGGIMANANLGILRGFEDVDISIVEMARILKTYYIDQGLKDIVSIGGKYCPVGASNDKNTNLNRHWVPNVIANYEMLEKSIDKEG